MRTEQFLQFMDKVHVYDLRQPLSVHTPPWPSYVPLSLQYFKRIAGAPMGQGTNGQIITTSNHVGTHMDGEIHFHASGRAKKLIATELLPGSKQAHRRRPAAPTVEPPCIGGLQPAHRPARIGPRPARQQMIRQRRAPINPDAHNTEDRQCLAVGAGIARKGWLTKSDVMDFLPPEEVKKPLNRG